VIHFTELCTMISYLIRDRFGLRASEERRKAVLQQQNEEVVVGQMEHGGPRVHIRRTKAKIIRKFQRICSAAAGVIASIFEELRMHERLKFLWYTGVHTLLDCASVNPVLS
jgi:transcriptional regulatory protein AMDR